MVMFIGDIININSEVCYLQRNFAKHLQTSSGKDSLHQCLQPLSWTLQRGCMMLHDVGGIRYVSSSVGHRIDYVSSKTSGFHSVDSLLKFELPGTCRTLTCTCHHTGRKTREDLDSGD